AISKDINIITERIKYCYPDTDDVMVVVDTNMLFYVPDFDDIVFEDYPCVTIMLNTTVLSEIDKKKITDNIKIKEKAEKISRQINEFMRRGDIHVGVPIEKNKLYIRILATEPSFNDIPQFLKKDHNDDRTLASYYDVFRNYPGYNVLLCTNDNVMRSKATLLGIPLGKLQKCKSEIKKKKNQSITDYNCLSRSDKMVLKYFLYDSNDQSPKLDSSATIPANYRIDIERLVEKGIISKKKVISLNNKNPVYKCRLADQAYTDLKDNKRLLIEILNNKD
ncbi:MAG: PIN domain-containing protein, partial [Planctomycetota bacterium]